MANPKHLEWLLEGVEAWNARRERDDFVPDFEAAEIRWAFAGAGKLDKLGRLDLNGVNLRGAHLKRTHFWGAHLRGAHLAGADLTGADLTGADLTAAHLTAAHLTGAHLTAADVRTVKSGVGTNNEITPLFTDLRLPRNLTQDQLNTMFGDSGTLLPEGLNRPDHWPDLDTEEDENPPPSPELQEDGRTQRQPDPTPIQTADRVLKHSRKPLVMTSASLLHQIAAFREQARGDNQLDAESRDSLLAFLDSISDSITNLIQAVPDQDQSAQEEDAKKVAGWFDAFWATFKDEGVQYFSAQNLGKSTIPTGIILPCMAVGGFFGGSLGAGVGALVGNLVTKQSKPGQTAEKVKNMI